MFDRILFAGDFCHFGYLVDMFREIHFQTFAEGQSRLWYDGEAKLPWEEFPMAAPHTRVTQPLDEWDEGTEVIHRLTDLLCYMLHTWRESPDRGITLSRLKFWKVLHDIPTIKSKNGNLLIPRSWVYTNNLFSRSS